MLNTRKWLFKWNIYIYVVDAASTIRVSALADDRRNIMVEHERSNGELNAIFVHRGMHNKLSNVFIHRKLRATLCTDGDIRVGGGGGESYFVARPITIRLLCLHNVPHCPSFDPLLARVSTYSPARNTIDESGASGISKRMQFKKEQ